MNEIFSILNQNLQHLDEISQTLKKFMSLYPEDDYYPKEFAKNEVLKQMILTRLEREFGGTNEKKN